MVAASSVPSLVTRMPRFAKCPRSSSATFSLHACGLIKTKAAFVLPAKSISSCATRTARSAWPPVSVVPEHAAPWDCWFAHDSPAALNAATPAVAKDTRAHVDGAAAEDDQQRAAPRTGAARGARFAALGAASAMRLNMNWKQLEESSALRSWRNTCSRAVFAGRQEQILNQTSALHREAIPQTARPHTRRWRRS